MGELEEQAAWNANAEAWSAYVDSGRDPNQDQIIIPTIDALLGDVSGRRILDVGCGEGALCRFLSRKDAIVTGIDFASEMIRIAKAKDPLFRIQYKTCAASDLKRHFNAASFDICIANMSLFSIANLALSMERICWVLKPGGLFIFSILHPCFDLNIYSNSSKAFNDPSFNNPDSIEWPVESYFNRRERYRKIKPHFPAETVIFVRMIEEYTQYLSENGMYIDRLVEPRPTDAVLSDETKRSHELYPRFPFFLVVRAVKRDVTDTQRDRSDVLREFKKFSSERNWERFQSTKNLAIALLLEAGELLEHFHWLETEEDTIKYINDERPQIEEEIADIYLNLIALADKTQVSLDKVALAKLAALRTKYSITRSKNRFITKKMKTGTGDY